MEASRGKHFPLDALPTKAMLRRGGERVNVTNALEIV
jgi:hypothetical protein